MTTVLTKKEIEMIKERIEDRVADWVQTYADAITKNYRDYHIRTLKGNLSGDYPEYAREQLDEIENGTAKLYKFVVKTGKRYYKIVQQEFETWEKSKYYGQYRDGSVHAFVDKKISNKNNSIDTIIEMQHDANISLAIIILSK